MLIHLMLKVFQRFRWWRLLLDSSVASGIALGVTAEEFWVCGRGGFGGFVYSSSSTGLDGLEDSCILHLLLVWVV